MYQCVESKCNRRDVIQYLADTVGIPFGYVYVIKKRFGKCALYPFMEVAIDDIRNEILSGSLSFRKIHYFTKIDASSHKPRNIGVQGIKQQVCDYIAVIGLQELFVRIGEYQCGVISPRG